MPRAFVDTLPFLTPLIGAGFFACVAALWLAASPGILTRSGWWIVIVLAAAVFGLQCAAFWPNLVDDAFIPLRYARNLAQGFGLVFSTDGSERVEGYSSFLWVLLETPLFALGLSNAAILTVVKLFGAAFGLATLLGVNRLCRASGLSRWAGALAVLLTASCPFIAFWAVGGLETAMYLCWLTWGLVAHAEQRARSRPPAASTVLFLLAALTRPEGAFLLAAFFVMDTNLGLQSSAPAERWKSMGQSLRTVIWFALPFGAYVLWRHSYYGFWLPNTFYARAGVSGLTQIARRAVELRTLVAYLLPLAALMAVSRARGFMVRGATLAPIASMTLIIAVSSLGVRREWMPGYRYELGAIPLLMCLVAASLSDLEPGEAGSAQPSYGAASRTVAIGCAVLYLLFPAVDGRGGGLYDGWRYSRGLQRAHVALGNWLRRYAPPTASYAGWDMGAVPYYSGLPRIIDIHPEGILDNRTTHLGYDAARFLSFRPAFLVLPDARGRTDTGGIQAFYVQPGFRQEYDSLFTVTFSAQVRLHVFKRRDAEISSTGLREGHELGELTRRLANQDQ